MDNVDDSTNKNEQELNLFSEQLHTRESDPVSDSTPAPDQPAPPPEAPVESDGDSTDRDTVVAPPISAPRKTAPAPGPRPGIVPPAVGRGIEPIPSANAVKPPYVEKAPAPAAPAQLPDMPQLRIQSSMTLGQMLSLIRADRRLGVEEVALSTKIRTEYLRELETDELVKVLPPVYISAYVRKLIETYDLSPDDANILLDKMRGSAPQDQEEIPEKLIESVNNGAMVNEGENKRIRNITILFITGIAVVTAALVWLVILLVLRLQAPAAPAAVVVPAPDSSNPAIVQPVETNQPTVSTPLTEPLSQENRLKESELDVLIVPETPTISVLKMSKQPGLRDTP